MPIEMKQRVKRICQTCGKEFEVLESRLKWGGTYCSQKCQRGRPRNKIKKTCIICGKSYYIWPYEMKVKAPTCSVECTKKYMQKKYNKDAICPVCKKEFWTSKKNPLKHCSMECRNKSYKGQKRGGSYHICPTCKKEFYVSKARVERGEGVYCSKKCHDAAPNKTIEQRIREGGLVELECAWCGKKFIRSRFFKDIQRYCSHSCAKKSRNETCIETKTREAMEKLGLPFQQEKTIRIGGKKPYFVDFYIYPDVVIECDGKFWHNPEKFPETYKKDIRKKNDLKRMGYKVYVLHEDEINRDIEGLIGRIASENNMHENPKIKNVAKQRKRTIIRKICKNCGNVFETIPSRKDHHYFCSFECRGEFCNINLKCKNCGRIFTIKRYAHGRSFCSMSCQKEFTKKKNMRKCMNCGKGFPPNPADVKRGKAKFCSRKCSVEFRYYR